MAKGRLSNDEIAWIKDNRDKMSADEMSAKLGRPVTTLRAYIGLASEPGHEPDISGGTKWEQLKKNFTTEECKFFRNEYENFHGQSEDEFLPAEEAQLTHAVTLGILINRSLAKQKTIEEDLNRIEAYRRGLEKKIHGEGRLPKDLEFSLLGEYRGDIKTLKSDLSSAVTQLTEFSKERNNILKQLKMTRDQRVQQLEDGKETFVGLIKSLSKRENRDKHGRRMELLRLAMEKQGELLGKFREYSDGNEDQPLLSFETVGVNNTTPSDDGGEDDHDEDAISELDGNPDSRSRGEPGKQTDETGGGSPELEAGAGNPGTSCEVVEAADGDGDGVGIREGEGNGDSVGGGD